VGTFQPTRLTRLRLAHRIGTNEEGDCLSAMPQGDGICLPASYCWQAKKPIRACPVKREACLTGVYS
ncbi:MAG: hypothetical protein ACOC9D_05865, partial [Thermodesulfobacteriota bacterium]